MTRASRVEPRFRVVEGGGAPSQATGPTDEEIVSAIASGDTRVAAALYDRVAVVVDRTMYRVFGRREHDHDDLVQTAFEQIVRSLAREKFAGACSLTTWASTLATHVGLNALRSRQRERKVVNRDASDPPEPKSRDMEREIEARAELAVVREALAAMAPEKAETLFLHDVEGLDLAEIATLTGVTVAAAQSRLVRARKELQERVNGGDHE
jgi:RNA polymerase sigma-70 factor (ECF subfamily)